MTDTVSAERLIRLRDAANNAQALMQHYEAMATCARNDFWDAKNAFDNAGGQKAVFAVAVEQGDSHVRPV